MSELTDKCMHERNICQMWCIAYLVGRRKAKQGRLFGMVFDMDVSTPLSNSDLRDILLFAQDNKFFYIITVV